MKGGLIIGKFCWEDTLRLCFSQVQKFTGNGSATYFLIKIIYLFIYFGRAGSLLLPRLFSGCSSQGLLSSRSAQDLIAEASLVGEHRL